MVPCLQPCGSFLGGFSLFQASQDRHGDFDMSLHKIIVSYQKPGWQKSNGKIGEIMTVSIMKKCPRVQNHIINGAI